MNKYKQKFIFHFTLAFIIYFGFASLYTQMQAQEMNKKSYIGLSGVLDKEWTIKGDNSASEFNSGWLATYGYQFSDIFSGEIAYGKTIDAEIGKSKLEADVMEISLLARLPYRISPFLRVGWSEAELTASFENETGSVSENSLLTGGGIDFYLVKNAGIRLEVNIAEYDLYGHKVESERGQLGIIIRF